MNHCSVYCRKCGTKINPDEKYCYKCGAEVISIVNGSKKGITAPVDSASRVGKIQKEVKKFLIKENKGKIALLIFLLGSFLMNIFFVPWVRSFPDKGVKSNLRNTRQVEYSNIFYMPSSFYDGLSPDKVGEKSKNGVSLSYDYGIMALHEVYLGIIVGIGYVLVSLKKQK